MGGGSFGCYWPPTSTTPSEVAQRRSGDPLYRQIRQLTGNHRKRERNATEPRASAAAAPPHVGRGGRLHPVPDQPAGAMLLFSRKKLSGSYFALISASRRRLRPSALSTP